MEAVGWLLLTKDAEEPLGPGDCGHCAVPAEKWLTVVASNARLWISEVFLGFGQACLQHLRGK